MPWIESHTTLARHPKTLRLARALGVDVPTAIGHLHLLWWWAIEYAQDGDLSRFGADELADACLWERPPDVLWTSVQGAGFVDADGVLHDWQVYAGKLIDRRKADAQRKREAREARSAEPVPDVRRTSGGRRRDGVRTVPNPTVPNHSSTTPVEGGPAREAGASARPPKSRGDPQVAAMIDALRAEGMTGTLTGRDRKAIADTEHNPAEVAALYAAIFRREYGSPFQHEALSVANCFEWLPGWQSHRAGYAAPKKRNDRPLSGAAAVEAVFHREGIDLGNGAASNGTERGRPGAGLGHEEAGRGVPRQLRG